MDSAGESTGRGYGVIFDMDGVLVDSYQAHLQSWRETARAWGRDMTEAQFARTFGRVSREIIAEHWGHDALSEADLQTFDHEKEAAYRRIVASNFPAMDGARELIAALHSAGFKLAVGSSGPPENVQLAIDRLQSASLFHALVTGRDVTRGKPDPQVFLVAAQRLGLEPGRCAVIEDAPVGIAAANAAGATSIAMLSTGHTREKTAAANPLLIVNSLRELSPASIVRLIGQAKQTP
jgi:beta-phosphoglucomutase